MTKLQQTSSEVYQVKVGRCVPRGGTNTFRYIGS